MMRPPPRTTPFPTRRSSDLYARVNLKIEGGKLTGNLNELKLEGTFKDNELRFKAKRPNGDHFGDFTGKPHGEKLEDRKSTRLNSSHRCISYAVFCLKKKTST